MSDMDDSKSGGSTDVQGLGRPDKPLGRGLEDVSHLFLSHRTDEAAANDRAVVRSNEPSSPPPPSRAGITLLRPASVTKDWLTIVLTEFDGALEEGLRTIDANIPCHPCGEIDLLALDRASHLTIIDFDTTVNDDLLLRGLGHFDWIVHNMPNVQRMYRDQTINVSVQPRLVLLAPQFSHGRHVWRARDPVRTRSGRVRKGARRPQRRGAEGRRIQGLSLAETVAS